MLLAVVMVVALFGGFAPVTAEAAAPSGNQITEWEANALLAGAGTSVVEIALENHYDNPNTDPYGMCGGNSHLQGICVDDELKYMFFSYTSALAMIEIATGELVASIGGFGGGSFGTNGGAHLGCIDYYDGYIYGSLEYKAPGKKFYLAIFDVNRMLAAGVGVSIQDESYDWNNPICTAVLLEEPSRDFRDPVDTTLFSGQDEFGHATNEGNNGHWFACSGIDGVSMGKWPGGKDDEIYMIVAYGVYQFSSSPRNDNTYNVLEYYKLSDIWNADGSQTEYNRTFTYQDGISTDWAHDEDIWLSSEKALYVYTGNTSYGAQNIEYEWDTGDVVLYTYGNTDGMGGTYYEVDGSVEPQLKTLNLGQHSSDEWAQNVAKAYANYPDAVDVDENGYMMGYVGTLKCVCGKDHDTEGNWPTGAPKADNFICSGSAPASATTGIAWIGPDPTDPNADWFYVADDSYSTGLFKRTYDAAGKVAFTQKVWLAEEPLDAEPVMHWTMDADHMANGVITNAVDPGTYLGYYNNVVPAEGYDGKAGGSLYFDGTADTLDYSRVWMGDAGIDMLQTLLDGGQITITFWYKPEYSGADTFSSNWSPILGIYSDDDWDAGNGNANGTRDPGRFVLVCEDRSGSLNMCMNNYGTTRLAWPVDIRSKGTKQHHSTDWHHIVMTVDLDQYYPGISSSNGGTSLYREMYVDGIKVGQERSLYPENKDTVFDLISDFEIGGAPFKAWYDTNLRGRFSGWIDDVKIYDVSVTDKQAAYLLQHTPVTSTQNYVPDVEEEPTIETTYVFVKDAPADVTIEWNKRVTVVSGDHLDDGSYTINDNVVTFSADWLMQRQPGVTTVKINNEPVAINVLVGYNPIVWYKNDGTDASGYGMNAQYYNGVTTDANGMHFNGYEETRVERVVLAGSDYLDKAINDSATIVFTFTPTRIVGNIANIVGLYDGARPALVGQTRDTGGERKGNGEKVQLAGQVFTESSKVWDDNIAGTAANSHTNDGQTYTAALVYDGSKLSYYLNGTLVATTDVADGAMDGVDSLVLGGPVNRNYATGISNKSQQKMTNFYGTVKNVAVYNSALTAEQIAAGISVSTAVDTSGLEYLIALVEALTPEDYENWEEEVEDALAAAKALNIDGTTQNMLDEVAANLLAGYNDLITVAKTITVEPSENGTVTADKTTANPGDTVTLTVTPDTYYVLGTLTVTDKDGNPVTVTNNTFVMPETSVTVVATFDHVCEWNTDWTYDASGHWHTCKLASCTEISDFNEHLYDDYTDADCDCGYVRPNAVITGEGLDAYYTGTAQIGCTNLAVTVEGNPVNVDAFVYVYSADPIDVGTYTVTVYVDDYNCVGSASFDFEIFKAPHDVDVNAPTGSYTAESYDSTTFTFTIVDPVMEGYFEYSTDGINWQDSPVFEGIAPGSTVTFFARVKELDNYLASDPSAGTSVTFTKLDRSDSPALTVTVSGDAVARVITIDPVEKAEYSFDGGLTWTTENTKTGLDGTTDNYVDVAIRWAETATYNAGPANGNSINVKKPVQTVTLDTTDRTATYGDGVLAARDVVAEGEITWTSSDETVASVDPVTGEITILKAGTVTITASAAETADYAANSASYTLTIAKKVITVSALNRQTIITQALPDFSAPAIGVDYVVDGMVYGDSIVVYLSTDADIYRAGLYTITITAAVSDKYDFVLVNGILTVVAGSTGDSGNIGGGDIGSGSGGSSSGGYFPVPSVECKCEQFTDIDTGLWYHTAICYVVDKGIMNGTGNGTTFSPYLNVSRAMLMTMLARLDGVDTSTGSTWYEAGMKWAMDKGISDGTNPHGDITREQLVTMLYRFAGKPATAGNLILGFKDADQVSDWAKDAMNWAVTCGIIQGGGDGNLNPQGTATRAEVAQILYNYLAK